MDIYSAGDTVALVLLVLIVLLAGMPVFFLALWKTSRPPFGLRSFRWLYLAWASLLAASMVWSLAREVLYSAEEVGANNFVRLAFLALGAAVIAFVGLKYRFVLLKELVSGVLGIFTVFMLWGLVSTLWSVSPAGTLYKSFEYGTMLALFALVSSCIVVMFKEPIDSMLAVKSIFDWHWFLLVLLMVSVYVGVLVLPEYAILRDYRDQSGVLGFSIQGALPGLSANAVGTIGALVGVVAFVRMLLQPRSRLLWGALLLLSLPTMVLTQSRSPILAFLLAVVVVLLASRRITLLLAFGTVLSVGAIVLIQDAQVRDLLYEFMKRGQSDENLSNLTGRVTYWQASLDAVREKPLGGYGANVGGRYVLEAALGDTVSQTHNLFIEVLVDTGVVGLGVLCIGMVATWFYMFKLRPQAEAFPVGRLLWLESLAVLTILSVRSLFAVTLVWGWYVLPFGIVLVFLSVMRRQVDRAHQASASIAQPLPAARRRRPSIRK